MGPGRHARMLLQTYQSMGNPDDAGEPLNSISSPPPPTSIISSAPSKDTSSLQNPPFDTSMGLTILVLLTALFFMGFFSIYIRRFSDESPVDLSRRRRFRGSSSYNDRTTSSLSPLASRYCTRKGLDPDTIDSLPVLRYGSGFGERYPVVVDCPICLGEFGEGESVKVIPSCRHFFHPGCIDTWLVARATCPVCRTTKLLSVEFDGKVVVSPDQEPDVDSGTVVEVAESATEAAVVMEGGMRRSCSCSSMTGRGGLQRTRSF